MFGKRVASMSPLASSSSVDWKASKTTSTTGVSRFAYAGAAAARTTNAAIVTSAARMGADAIHKEDGSPQLDLGRVPRRDQPLREWRHRDHRAERRPPVRDDGERRDVAVAGAADAADLHEQAVGDGPRGCELQALRREHPRGEPGRSGGALCTEGRGQV